MHFLESDRLCYQVAVKKIISQVDGGNKLSLDFINPARKATKESPPISYL
jgi:hypothetical protein